MLQNKDDLFKGNSASNLRVLDGRLIDELSVSIVVFNFEEKRLKSDGLVTEGVKSTEDSLQIFPILLAQYTALTHIMGLFFLKASDIWSVKEEYVEELSQR